MDDGPWTIVHVHGLPSTVHGPMAKYDPLRQYLESLPRSQQRVTLGFGRIEQLVGEALPPSAYQYEAWWLGGRGGRARREWREQVQVEAWEAAGWTVDELDLRMRMVSLRRR